MTTQQSQSVFAARLKAARKMAGLSLQELADRLGITKQAVNKYEQGSMQPTSTVLIKLAQALDVKVDYFFRKKQVELQQIEFRKKTKLSKKEQEAILEKATDFLERYLELEELLGIDNRFINPLANAEVASVKDAEQAAHTLREKWELGMDPIPNIIEMLEEKGIRIFEVEASEAFDGMCAQTGSAPLIVINKSISDLVRKRFTVVHELAHILLTISSDLEHRTKESLCHTFAGAFLLPDQSLLPRLGSHRSHMMVNELLSIKESFGISIRAIVRRTLTLGIITESLYKGMCIRMNKEWGGKDEPGTYAGIEKSTRFWQLLYRAVAEEIISIGKAASIGNTTTADFDNITEPKL